MIVGGGNSISHIAEIRPESYATGVDKNILNFYVGGWNNNQDSGTAKMTITSDGDVGIGTTNPAYKLDVNGTGRFTDTLTVSGTGNSSFAGNVGIGTTIPGGKLDVEAGDIGVAAGDATTAAIFRAGRQNVWFQNQRTASGADWNDNTFKIIAKIDDTSHQSINFVNDASYNEHIDIYTGNQVFNTRFDANGNVGIGETIPSEKLDVNGTVKATDYKGYLTTFQHGGFLHSSSLSSATIYYIPTNSTSETTTSQSYNNFIAPYDGRIKSIIMKWTGIGTSPTATSVTFRKAINGAISSTIYPATVTSPATIDMLVERDFLNTDISFQAGDRVQLGFTTDGGTRLLQQFAFTVVLEYNKI